MVVCYRIAFQILRNYKLTTAFIASRMSVVSQSYTSMSLQSKEVTFPVPWGHIAAKAWGNPMGKPVLAVHGWLDNSGSFDKLIPLLSEELYVVAIDWPGHGKSSHRPKGVHYDAYNYIADIKYVIDALKWKKFSFLAHSMGGGAASWFAGALHDLVETILCIESYGFWAEPMENLPKLMGHSLNHLESLEDRDSKIYPTLDEIIDRMIEGHIRMDSEFNREAAITLCNRGVRKLDTGGYQFTRDLRAKSPSLLKVAHEMDAIFLKAVQCPMLVIIGETTLLSSPFFHKKLAAAADHQTVKVVTVPGSHHMHLIRPEGMYKVVDHFLLHSKVHPDFHDQNKL